MKVSELSSAYVALIVSSSSASCLRGLSLQFPFSHQWAASRSRNHSPSAAKGAPLSAQEQNPDVLPAKETPRKMGTLRSWSGLIGVWQEFSISQASQDPLLWLHEPGSENERWGILKGYFFFFLKPRQFPKAFPEAMAGMSTGRKRS